MISLQHLVSRPNAGKIVHLTLVQVQRLLQFGVLLVHDPSDISGRHHANQRWSLLHIPIGYHPLLPDLALIQNAHLVVFYSFLDLLFNLVVDVGFVLSILFLLEVVLLGGFEVLLVHLAEDDAGVADIRFYFL